MAAPEVVEVDPKGDVFLVCTSTDGSIVKIRVSSAVLSLGSPVFKTMLGPRFKEGQALATTSSVELPLSDDDAEAIKTICQVAHLRNNEVPPFMPIQKLLDIAALVDKYACADAMRHAGQIWISQLLDEIDSEIMSQLLIAAYHFKLADLFGRISKNLVMRSQTKVGTSSVDRPLILYKVFDTIEAVKRRVIDGATRFFESQIKDSSRLRATKTGRNYRCHADCSCFEHYLFGLITKLDEVKLWPRGPAEYGTPEHLLTTLEAFHVDWPSIATQCEGFDHTYYCVGDRVKSDIDVNGVNGVFCQQAKTLRSFITLPCLACVQEDNVGDDAVCIH